MDVIIGTHRLLGKDVKYKDLGLLVVDEEQRFGVKHKEAIKQLKRNIDVLTLSATPIPPHPAHVHGGHPGHEPFAHPAGGALPGADLRGGVFRRPGA